MWIDSLFFRSLLLATSISASACAGAVDTGAEGDDPGDPSTGYSAQLTVGGHHCPTSGHVAGTRKPGNHKYGMTTFGGGADTQPMACGGVADGHSLYIADASRFGCGAHVKVTNPMNGRWCVAKVADVGPNICVEQAAGLPVIDASPAIAHHLFGVGGIGWSDHKHVVAEQVASHVALGCH